MIRNINKPKANVIPGSKVISSAIDLCAAFGGGDKILVGLLTEMKEVQETNEGILKDANQAYNDISAAKSALGKREKTLDEKVLEQQSALTVRAAEITSKEAALTKAQNTFKNAKRVIINDLENREKSVIEDRKQVNLELREAILKSSHANVLDATAKKADQHSRARTFKLEDISKRLASILAEL